MSRSSDEPRPTTDPDAQPHGALPHGGPLGALADAAWQAVLAAGVAAVALGVVVLVWPGASLRVVGVLFGIYLLATGAFHLAATFGSHIPGHLRALHFVSGALLVLLGVLCFRGAAESILLLALWIGFGWLLRGMLIAASAASAPAMPARGWQIFLGIMMLLAGMVLIIFPFASIAVLTEVTGIVLVVLGLTEVVHGFQLRHQLRRLTPAGQTVPRHTWRPHLGHP
ncbi:HdeD family acid-resistance protein [Streptomyces silvisoli]|uniref:DUF308 domain-containing protein n=1 Tax=Streptomyces silvisoli TaxID=3034235 RepID=A0ABT5ZTQ7_9ACTN|nr:DUF308 domain-containing protein [Streptomyces silvisoli]MDF3293220.1 DUF308 domain-containing protein [Streptomyces silvisoli]